jgi:TonB family protein
MFGRSLRTTAAIGASLLVHGGLLFALWWSPKLVHHPIEQLDGRSGVVTLTLTHRREETPRYDMQNSALVHVLVTPHRAQVERQRFVHSPSQWNRPREDRRPDGVSSPVVGRPALEPQRPSDDLSLAAIAAASVPRELHQAALPRTAAEPLQGTSDGEGQTVSDASQSPAPRSHQPFAPARPRDPAGESDRPGVAASAGKSPPPAASPLVRRSDLPDQHAPAQNAPDHALPVPPVSRSDQVPSIPKQAASGQPAGMDGQAKRNLARVIHNPPPEYPPAAVAQGREGTVWLYVDVNAEGEVTKVELAASSGHGDLDAAAAQTVRSTWRFQPKIEGGLPVPSRVRIFVRFRR